MVEVFLIFVFVRTLRTCILDMRTCSISFQGLVPGLSKAIYCITSWQIDGKTTETVRDFIFLGSEITADGDFSHEIKRHLPLERKSMTNLDSILKSRDITLPTKVHLVRAIISPVVMYGCESWNIK